MKFSITCSSVFSGTITCTRKEVRILIQIPNRGALTNAALNVKGQTGYMSLHSFFYIFFVIS